MTFDGQRFFEKHHDSTGVTPGSDAQVESDAEAMHNATIIVNADDWGRDVETTDRELECVLHEVVSSVSAMMFMEDSERAALLALQHGIDAGLHLNFTMPFSAPQCSSRLLEHQQAISQFLKFHRLAPVLYNPRLAASFEYVVRAQLEEFERLYGAPPARLDGHHHMHLCSNVLFQNLLPKCTTVRRNFSFAPGDKSYMNRLYRRWQDRWLSRRHRTTDFFFCLRPYDPPGRLQKIFELALYSNVEVETHPINRGEYEFLHSEAFKRCAGQVAIAQGYTMRFGGPQSEKGSLA
ncbi:MAG: ChbG/HpnK family deacetylase [Terracidiphilus sp.]|nr:ChbG/HpnK family deacetylase [Terracidiphilus sp.]MDR3775551.1 ChbG/HpnK family deacetylase [Terracidiphilus sp.]